MPESSQFIGNGWDQHVSRTYDNLPKDSVQYKELRRAFCAGAYLVVNRAGTLARHDRESYLTEVGVWREELDRLAERIKAGA